MCGFKHFTRIFLTGTSEFRKFSPAFFWKTACFFLIIWCSADVPQYEKPGMSYLVLSWRNTLTWSAVVAFVLLAFISKMIFPMNTCWIGGNQCQLVNSEYLKFATKQTWHVSYVSHSTQVFRLLILESED